MPSNLEALLPKFKNRQLKQLAFLCGAKNSGRKSDLVERLTGIAATRATKPPAAKNQPLVLSIDLGIRNLGFSLLSPVTVTPRSRSSKSLSPADKIATLTADDLRSPPRINLHAWQRRELLEPSADKPNDPDRFTPISLALAADRLVRQDLLPLKPTQVLIERQRWRSGGAAAIQEWTLRVNTLEAMLHASLRTLRELGHWDGEITSVAPDRVTRFWPLAPGETDSPKSRSTGDVAEKATKGAKSQQSSKRHKLAVLTSWLTEKRGSDIILPANRDTEAAMKHFRAKLTGARRSKATDDLVSDVGPRKLDDLTDCLLQGVAWLKWEENIRLLLDEEGITKLLDSNLLDERETGTILDDEV